MAKRPSVFGYAWRGFRLLRHRSGLTVAGAARRSALSKEVITYSETRLGNVDFLVADRLLRAYNANIVDLGLMIRLAEKHLADRERDSLHSSIVPAILAEFEELRAQASPSKVPMPDPARLLREIDQRIAPIEALFREAFRGLEAVRSALPAMARHLGAEWDQRAEEVRIPQLPRWFSGIEEAPGND
jgi:hypothetical protein